MLKKILLCLLSSGVVFIGTPALAQVNITQAPRDRPVLRIGSEGEAVKELQAMLKLLNFYTGDVTGNYDETTVIAVSRFQESVGLPIDGIVGAQTWSRLLPQATANNTTSNGDNTSTDTSDNNTANPDSTDSDSTQNEPKRQNYIPVLREGMRGDSVRFLQQRLKALELLEGQVDGVFGSRTLAAVQALQRQSNITVDGVVGPATWQVLFPPLREGMRGDSVRFLQQRLKALELLEGQVDGVFGSQTLEAVQALQRRSNITVDGVVGPATWQVLFSE